MSTWSAPVRYAEIDGQHIVFNAHYLTYCDEAIAALFDQLGLRAAAAHIKLVASQLTWSGSARWRHRGRGRAVHTRRELQLRDRV